jgi:hypothetical protein
MSAAIAPSLSSTRQAVNPVAKVLLVLGAAATVFRLPEDYTVQPSYLALVLIPVSLWLLALRRPVLEVPRGQVLFVLACFFCFFLINLVHYVIAEFPVDRVQFLAFWPLATFFLYTLTQSAFLAAIAFLVRAIGFWVFVSAVVAVVQFATAFPTRATGVSGTATHLAIQVVHLYLMVRVLGLKFPTGFLRAAALLSLARAYVVYFMLSTGLASRGSRFAAIVLLVVASLAGLWVYQNSILDAEQLEFFEERFSTTDNPSDSSGRGLMRVLLYPQYLAVGGGEIVQNYDGDPFTGNVHSNFIGLVFCFGVSGLALTLWFFRELFRRVGWAETLAYFAYSLTLYYFNNVIFLVLIAVLLVRGRMSSRTSA